MSIFKHKGSALISALFIMTLVAIAATAMSVRLQLDIYRTQLTIASDKLYFASQFISFWAMSELNNPKNIFIKALPDGRVRTLPASLQTIYPNLIISGGLYDLQSRFNLNNLVNKRAYNGFLIFLKHIDPQLKQEERNLLLVAFIEWLSVYKPGDSNKFSENYLKNKPPYYPAHQLMQSISEFRLVNGVSSKIYSKLASFITVLPEATPININTASTAILSTLGAGLNEMQVNEIISKRGDGFLNLKKLNPLMQKLNITNEEITIESQYFLSVGVIKNNESTLINYTVFKRTKDKKGKISVTLIAESLNTL